MKAIVAAGTIKAGHTDMVLCFNPKSIGWNPQPDPDARPDHDAERKRRIEDNLSDE
jgi:hypothetical protein